MFHVRNHPPTLLSKSILFQRKREADCLNLTDSKVISVSKDLTAFGCLATVNLEHVFLSIADSSFMLRMLVHILQFLQFFQQLS